MDQEFDFSFLRKECIGIDAFFETPYGQRLLVYCDYTASGRCLRFIERYLMDIQRTYANTHTEDDVSGRSMTLLLHQAEQKIKEAVNAGPDGRLIAVGAGSTAAIDKCQQILGVQLPPATRCLLSSLLCLDPLIPEGRSPVVFVGPYEHHSNEVTWRQGIAEVHEVGLSPDGGIDLDHLEALLRRPQNTGRRLIGSFSAASNVTGRLSPVHDIAALLHRYGAIACFDYAASSPYVRIDMCPEPSSLEASSGEDRGLDAIFLSPHKLIGGPGSAGILVFKKNLYDCNLDPTVGGGGTVDYVGPSGHDFVRDIEQREKAGTPGVLQTMKAALAYEVKERIGPERLEEREQQLLRKAFDQWTKNPNIEILGNPDPSQRIAIVSFNLKDPRGGYLHPRLATVLLNDLFGIQSRAGCSCAGPYGHRLLNIDEDLAGRYRRQVLLGHEAIKPGWCRIGFHFIMDDLEADYIIQAVDFLARRGWLFVSEYHLDLDSGTWTHKSGNELSEEFSLDAALSSGPLLHEPLSEEKRAKIYKQFLNKAEAIAHSLESLAPVSSKKLPGELGELQFFSL
jgi:selenocysteine lyase/cysteine desulfurase